MDDGAQEWIAAVALFIAVLTIVAGMAMIFSWDWITKIEGMIAALSSSVEGDDHCRIGA